MSTSDFMTSRSRSRDQQDGVERHVWGEMKNVPGAGHTISVRGTDTLDQDAPVLNTGYSFRLPSNSNAEVFLISMGSDTNQKMAILSLPRDKQRDWPEGAGGIQNPVNPDLYVEINGDGIVLRHGKMVLGNEGGVTIEVSGGDIKIIGNLTVEGTLEVNGSSVTHNGVNIGDTHVHGGVDPGSGTSGVPQ